MKVNGYVLHSVHEDSVQCEDQRLLRRGLGVVPGTHFDLRQAHASTTV